MAFPRLTCFICLSLAAAAAMAASAPNPAVVDPTQRMLFDDLFLAAHGPQPSFGRYLLPGRADAHLAWFPQMFLVPLASTSTPAAPIPGYLIGNQGQLPATPVTLGQAQGTGIAGAAVSSNACYMADATTNDLAAYAVDVETQQFSNVAGAPFAGDGSPNGISLEPSGRFLYAANSTGQSVTAYAIDLATAALTKIGTVATSATHPHSLNSSRQCLFVTNTGSGGYEVFAINSNTGALGGVPGSPFGTHQSSSAVRTPDGNFVYFSPAGLPEIEGFFVDPTNCALTPLPGSPFTGPAGGVLRINADLPVLYAAAGGSLQAFAIDPATGTLSPAGSALPIDPDTGAMVVGPKGEFLWLADLANRKLRSVALDPVTGFPTASGAPVGGPANVEAMVLENENGGELVGRGVTQARTNRNLGGAPPYSLALVGGALPAGLTLDTATGEIVGKPTRLGESTFDLLITDAVGAQVHSVRTLKVIPPAAIPAAPSNLTATALSATEVKLQWQDNANQTGAFQIQLSQDGGPFLEVQAVKPVATTTIVAGLSPATSYTFRLRAANTGGGTTDSTTATVSTPALAPAACTPNAHGQCLLGNRFLLEALYQDAQGHAGLANVVPITTDTAYVWFFSPTNVEAVVKVLDGCALGGHYWIFAGGLTNVHVMLRVTDTAAGAVRYYEVPYGPAFTPIQDTAAFGTCNVVPADASGDMQAAQTLQQGAVAEIKARLTAAPIELPPTSAVATGVAGCHAGSTVLCLNNNRFAVQATFNAGSAGSGTAQVGQLTSDTGYLWFFSSSNVEAIIKVLDGCGLGGHYWVFAGGLTNVNVTLTVTDTLTGLSKQYVNPPNVTFEPIQDTSAFSTCP